MRIFRSTIFAIACLALLARPIAAQSPTAGAVREYAPGTQLSFRFGGSYPAWVQTAVRSAATDFSAPAWNNSRTPTFPYSPGGAGMVSYSAAHTSPCGTGNTQWLQCSANWSSSAFRIFIRDFSGAPISNWTWCDIGFAGLCWDAERALLHEMEHVVLGIAGHDPQGDSNTIMGAVAPAYPAATWNTHHIQRCDEAAAQLRYGVASPYGQFADCFRGLARTPQTQLVAAFTLYPQSIAVCLNQPAQLSGRIAIARVPYAYGALSDTPLAGRIVTIDRRPHTSSVWTLNIASTTASAAAGVNWTRAISTSASSPVTYDFRMHTPAEPGVEATAGVQIVVTWRAC